MTVFRAMRNNRVINKFSVGTKIRLYKIKVSSIAVMAIPMIPIRIIRLTFKPAPVVPVLACVMFFLHSK